MVLTRIAELINLGMDASRARAQAKAELAKGVLSPGCCQLEGQGKDQNGKTDKG